MNASTRPDVNAVSISGETQASDYYCLSGNYFSQFNPGDYASLLKVSDGAKDLTFSWLVVPNGYETAIDTDWATNVHYEGFFGGRYDGCQIVDGDNILRFKGGCRNCSVAGTLFSRGHRNGDIEVGDWFDQNYALTRGIDLSGLTLHADGAKNSVVVGWAVPFSTKLGRNCSYLVWESMKLKAYVLFKFAVRFLLGIPKGTKGPPWL